MSDPVRNLDDVTALLVDDNPHMCAIFRAILKGMGIVRAHVAADGAAAVETLGRESVDLAVVDLAMPVMDGIELTRRIRAGATGAPRTLPVLMVSGISRPSAVFAARDAGVNEFLVKPVAANTMLERLRAMVETPRPFVVAPRYAGPCRRRRALTGPDVPRRRHDDVPAGGNVSPRTSAA